MTLLTDIKAIGERPEVVDALCTAYWGTPMSKAWSELDEAFKDEMRSGMKAAIDALTSEIGAYLEKMGEDKKMIERLAIALWRFRHSFDKPQDDSEFYDLSGESQFFYCQQAHAMLAELGEGK